MYKLSIALVAIGVAALPMITQRDMTAAGAHAFSIAGIEQTSPPESWAPQDPADALWRAGRSAINDSDWTKAADQFRRIRTESAFRSSVYRGQSHYWEAYARTQLGGSAQLRQAQSLLATLMADFPEDARNIRDAESLLASVEGRLSRDYGDPASAARLRESVQNTADGCPDMDDDNNPKAAALNALVQMDTDVAMPILEKILANRETCAGPMRARAIWLVAQQQTPRAADLLLQVAKSDPDAEVREQAVFWLSQVDGDKAIVALEEILRSSASASLHENALFALSQNGNPRAGQILREFATRQDVSTELRANAIHWLSQTEGGANAQFLRDLFGKVQDNEIREQILFAISQGRDAGSGEWLMNLVMDEKQDIEMRKQALFWYAQGGEQDGARAVPSAQLIRLYDRMTDPEMKEQLIFVFSQNGDEKVYVDKLMDIAKNDRTAELRTKAIFWLGQVGSKDPRVAQFLADLING